MLISFFIVGIYPLIEGRESIVFICKKMYIDLTKKNRRTTENTGNHATEDAHIDDMITTRV